MKLHARVFRSGVFAAIAAMVLANCLDDAGSNRNERKPGNGEDGVAIWAGEIAIDPTGHYLVTANEHSVVYGDLETGETRRLSQLRGTTRLAFDHAGKTLFASMLDLEVNADVQLRDNRLLVARGELEFSRLVRFELARNKQVWSRFVDIQTLWDPALETYVTYPLLELTRDDARLIVTQPREVQVVDAESGKLLYSLGGLPGRVVDVDLTPDQSQLVVTLAHEWVDREHPRTLIRVLDLGSFAVHEIEVPNCSSELAITPDGKHALLAPPDCRPPERRRHDPVSVIDLEHGEFVRNLPGFGPVALAEGGTLAVAFMDREAIDESLFDDPAQIPTEGPRYRLMLIDTASLSFETIELGDELPRYAVAPDGQLLLVDSPKIWDDGRIRLLDTKTRELSQLAGPGLDLDNYVMTRDSTQVFLLSDGLFRISLPERRAYAEPITFTPTRINITPDDRRLVLREDASTVWLYEIETSEMKRSLDLDR